MAIVDEIEDKYDVAEDTVLPGLTGLRGVADVAGPVVDELEATYFDTRDLALARAGITLRRRTGGSDAGWHLKLPVPQGRHEVRVSLERSVGTVPKPLRLKVAALVRDESLVPVATIRTRRTTYRLLDDEASVLAEVSDDRVRADGLAWREWEVERAGGGRKLLKAVAAALTAAGARPAEASSKLERALGQVLPPPAPGPRPRKQGPARDVVLSYLSAQVAEVRRNDPLVRCDLPDAIHAMRVATRRLRSALATFRPLVDREVTDPLRDELRWLNRALGPARDTEVMHARLRAMLADEPAGLTRGRARQHVDRELRADYRRTFADAVAALASPRYFALLDSLDELVASPPWTGPASKPARKLLPGLVRRDWKRLRRRVKRAAASETPDQREERLHDVRKAARRARYAAESVEPLCGKDARRFAKLLKRLQSVLGDHHDTVVTRDRLRDLATSASRSGLDSFTFGVLHVRAEAGEADLERTYRAAWHDAARRRNRRWLG